MSSKIAMIIILAVLSTVTWVFGSEPGTVPAPMAALRGLEGVDFCGEPVPFQEPDVRERFEKEMLLSVWDRPQVILWLKRYRRYMPHIEAVLKENGLPDDFKYVAVIESALRPHAGSRKGAIGFWQFMADTGRRYGLRIDKRIDERRSVFASTRAAAEYFNDLYRRTGSWTLAAAAYNMGEEGLEAEILVQGTRNFYRLYLPLETQRFVFRILSAKLVLSQPERYGFYLGEEDYYPPLRFDRVDIQCFEDMPIRAIAEAAQTGFKTIKDLNPDIRGHFLVSGSHSILIPRGSGQGFHDCLKTVAAEYHETRSERIYIVKEGDNLSVIADRFDVPLPALLIWNRIDLKRPIHPGDRLVIHPKNRGEFDFSPDTGVNIDNK